jgi:uncharacterized protein (TIGR00255 family)
MHSMTGYGRCRLEADGRALTIEIKTVNHRFLDLSLRLPRPLMALEDRARKAIGAALSRGHADVFVGYQNTRGDARQVRVDLPLAGAYQRALEELAAQVGVQADLSLSQIAQLPDILTVTEGEDDLTAIGALLEAALSEALADVTQMRAREGEAMRQDLTDRLNCLADIAAQIAGRAPQVVEAYRARLQARIEEAMAAPPDPQRLLQEVALFADRAAIDEELARLDSHIAQIRAALASAEPVGRKLDFLVQELNREVNTIGSKASDGAIAALIVAAKAEIEKMREQVQNIE